MFRPQKPSAAFTLLELIVVIVILAVLAAIAIPTFAAVIDRSHDESAETSISAYARSVQAHAGFRADGALTGDDFAAAAVDFQQMAVTPGVHAADYNVLVRSHPTIADRFPAHSLAVVSYALSADEQSAGVAAVSASGNCVAVKMTATSVQTVPMPESAEMCTGRTALDPTKPEKGDPLDPTNPGDLQTPDLQYSSRTTTSATVTWAAVPGAASYQVEVAEHELMTGATTSTTTERTHTVPTTWDAPRYVRVSAVAGSSKSTASRVVRVVGALEAPTNAALTLDDATATISWHPVSGAAGYRIYQDGSAVFVRQVPGGSTDRTTFELAPGQTASFVVKAYNTDGESAGSNSVGGTVTAQTPSGVTAKVEGDEVVVSWSEVKSASGYEVYRNSVIGATVVGAENTSYRFPIEPGETLKFAVRAYDPHGQSAASAEVSATRAPAAPTVSHTAVDNTVTFTWTAPTGATSYKLYLNSDPVETVTATSKTYTLPYSSTNTFKVVANNAGGDGAASNTVTMTVVPAAPTGVSASANETTATVKWTPVTGANGYNIYNAATDTQVATAFGQTAGEQTVPMTAGETSSYYVRAYGDGGSSKASNTATTAAVPTAPATVSSTISGTTVTVTWARSSTADAYELYKGSVWVRDVDGGNVTSTTTTVNPGETATFSVLAKNTAGKSAATVGNSVTAAPAATTLSGSATGTTANLSWTAVPNATSYNVHRTGTTAPVATGIKVLTWSQSGLTEGTSYSYRVVAVANGVAGPDSNTVTVTTIPPTPAAPTTSLSGTTVTVSWSSTAGAASYTLYRSTNGATAVAVGGVLTGTSYSDTGRAAGATYGYSLTASNAAGTSSRSGTTSVTLAPATPTVTDHTMGDATITLTVAKPFSDGYGTLGYRVYDGASTTPLTSTFDASTGVVTVTGLTNGTTYTLQLEAWNAAGSARGASLAPMTPEKIVVMLDRCVNHTNPDCLEAQELLLKLGYTAVTYDPTVDTTTELAAGSYTLVVANANVWGLGGNMTIGNFLDSAQKGGYEVLSLGNDVHHNEMPLYTSAAATATLTTGNPAQYGFTPAGTSSLASFTGGPSMKDSGYFATGLRSDVSTFATWKFDGIVRPVGVSVGSATTGRWVHLQGTSIATDPMALPMVDVSMRWLTTGR